MMTKLIIIREIDQYGFERSEDFDYDSYEKFMAEYLSVLARRLAKWEKMLNEAPDVSRSNKGITFYLVKNCIPNYFFSVKFSYSLQSTNFFYYRSNLSFYLAVIIWKNLFIKEVVKKLPNIIMIHGIKTIKT